MDDVSRPSREYGRDQEEMAGTGVFSESVCDVILAVRDLT